MHLQESSVFLISRPLKVRRIFNLSSQFLFRTGYVLFMWKIPPVLLFYIILMFTESLNSLWCKYHEKS